MGVVNITPDSFSDGGRLLDSTSLENKLSYFETLGVDVVDIGAESTAPFNESIDKEAEKERLVPFIRLYRDLGLNFKVSLDSYKEETAFWFFNELKTSYGIWNDVSGKFDDSVLKFLIDNPRHQYVWCHNNAPERELSGKHMDYVSGINIFIQLENFFKNKNLERLSDRVIFDPCFGFSKSYEQNWEIIDNWHKWNELFANIPVVFGVSKKSFLRKKLLDTLNIELNKEDVLSYSELLHERILRKIHDQNSQKTFFRVHDPVVAKIAFG